MKNEEVFKIRANKSKRCYTITLNGKVYRTCGMSKDEFFEADYFTQLDWKNYINKNDVTRIK